MKKRGIIVGALPESLINFRGELIKKLQKEGVLMTAMSAPVDSSGLELFKEIGVRFVPYDVERSGFNPFSDLKIFYQLIRSYRIEKPDFIIAYTIKPVVWGGIAARFSGIRFFPLITGLGFAFQGHSLRRRLLTKLVSLLYRWALSGAEVVIFQNPDNLNTFVRKKILDRDKCILVAGSGVCTSYFYATPIPALIRGRKLTFLCMARLLGDKGLREYAKAAELVKQRYPLSEFCLLGPFDPSPDGISESELSSWNAINYLGESSDVRPYIKQCHVYVLPSYHEGLPRSTLEAMSMGRPVLTTNAVGCKETVVEGKNGFKVDAGDVDQLAQKMIWCIENTDQLELMGSNSRKMVEERFDVSIVNKQIASAMGLS